jgi:hypothetical protein
MNNGLRSFLMDKKFKKLLSTLDQLPNLNKIGKLNINHLKIMRIIQKNSNLPVKDIISHPELTSISQAQRYRYIDQLIKLNLIKYCCKNEVALV